MKRKLGLIGGGIGLLVGMGLVMPAVAELQQHGSLPAMGVGLLLIGYTIIVGGGSVAIGSLRR